MRIAIAQLSQESNTFNPLPTTRQNFEDFGHFRGTDVVERMADVNELGGFIQSLRQWPEAPEIVPLVRLMAWPSGMATADTFEWARDEIIQPLAAQLPVDGVLLSLHGAMVADQHFDVEGEMLSAVRAVVGANVPIVATLDLHASVTRRMAEQADALVLFHTAPHLDVFETGQRGAALLRRILVDGARPVTAFVRIPAVIPAEMANTQDPASPSYSLRELTQRLDGLPGILAAGWASVQPWLDVPDLGSTALVVADGQPELASRTAAELAQALWDRRTKLLPDLAEIEPAIRDAFDRKAGLTVLSDSADATTSGAPGDSTWLLREMLKYDWPRPALVPMVAPEIVEQARLLGVGNTLTGPLGGRRDTRFSQPVQVSARVERLFDAQFILQGHLAKNLAIDMGPSVVLRVGNVHILATTRSGPHFAPQFFQTAGCDPYAAQLLIAKSPCGFRAAYAPHAAKISVVRAPGCAPADYWRYPYQHVTHPVWPWDEMDEWSPDVVMMG
ncbi:MAG: M81 family metallopeptidase [Pirellulales bacterium]